MRVLLVFLVAVAVASCRPSGEAEEAENQHQESRAAATPCKEAWADKDLNCKMDMLWSLASLIWSTGEKVYASVKENVQTSKDIKKTQYLCYTMAEREGYAIPEGG